MVRTLLLEESPLVVQPSLAVAIGGLNEAIILQKIHYWLNNSKHHYDGRKWIYNTMSEWNNQFPFWSLRTVERTFKKLIDSKILITANYNKSKIDKTTWYSINYEVLNEKIESYYNPKQEQTQTVDNISDSSPEGNTSKALRQNDGIEVEELPSRDRQNDETIPPKCQIHTDNLGEAIPETTTKTTTENNLSQSIRQSDIDHSQEADKDGLTDEKLTEKQLLEKILSKCEIEAACQDKDIARVIVAAVQNLYYNSAFAKETLCVPLEVVRENLRNLNSGTIMYAVYKLQRAAAYGTSIFNPVKYLQSCIYNAISEYPASLLVDQNLAQMCLDNKETIKSDNIEVPKTEVLKYSIIESVKGTPIEQPIRTLQNEMAANAFEQYLATAKIEFVDKSIVRIIADSEFSANFLECRYKGLMADKFKSAGFAELEIVSQEGLSA